MKSTWVLVFLSFLVLLCPVLLNAEPEPTPVPESTAVPVQPETAVPAAPPGENAQPAEQGAPLTPVPSPAATAEQSAEKTPADPVGALDEWVAVPEKKVEPGFAEDDDNHRYLKRAGVDKEEEAKIFHELLLRKNLEAQPEVEAPPPLVRNVTPLKADKLRLRKLKSIRRQELAKQTAWLKARSSILGRGGAELRVCTLNLDNYSTKDEVRRVLRGVPKGFRAKEKAIVNVIAETGCGIVALQGIVGSSYARAKEGADHLAEEVSKTTQSPWKAYIGEVNNGMGHNGFLVSDYNIEVVTTRSYVATPLPPFAGSPKERFSRGPFELEVQVKNRNSAAMRRIVLITMHLHSALDNLAIEDEAGRMQMAEAMRRILIERQQRLSGDPTPIVIVLGDRGGSQTAPATRILEGVLQLKSFSSKGECKLIEIEIAPPEPAPGAKEEEVAHDAHGKPIPKKKPKAQKIKVAECEGKPGLAKLLFGISAEGLPPPPQVAVRKVDDKDQLVAILPTEKQKRARFKKLHDKTSEIYTVSQNLRWFWKDDNAPLDYVAGQVTVKETLPTSPLVWAELNW